jgi:hypothetical protein
MKSMWADFMLDDPRMTNSTFNEGYDVSGALHYPAYADDARISHAHGWSTGPLIALSNYVAGLHVLNSTAWRVEPQPGNLASVDAGFTTAIGTFASTYEYSGKVAFSFQTPPGTTGTVVLTGVSGSLKNSNGTSVPLNGGVAEGVPGGNWTLVLSGNSTGTGLGNGTYGGGSPSSTGSSPAYTGGAAGSTWSGWAVMQVTLAVVFGVFV